MELVVLSNSFNRLNTSKYFSLEQDALWFLTPAGFLFRSSSLNDSVNTFCPLSARP